MINSSLQREFFTPGHNLFAILDGAAVPSLLNRLHQYMPEQVCLYREEVLPDLAEVAPYLVRLERDSRFTDWLFDQGWGKHWGIFARTGTKVDLKQARHHFRTLSRVEFPDGRADTFRFYDPRVLRVFLPACNEVETQTMFGPVVAYFVEDDTTTNCAIRFTINQGLPYDETVRLD